MYCLRSYSTRNQRRQGPFTEVSLVAGGPSIPRKWPPSRSLAVPNDQCLEMVMVNLEKVPRDDSDPAELGPVINSSQKKTSAKMPEDAFLTLGTICSCFGNCSRDQSFLGCDPLFPEANRAAGGGDGGGSGKGAMKSPTSARLVSWSRAGRKAQGTSPLLPPEERKRTK